MVLVISLRYHVVSLTAVFLALALGAVLGASGLSDRLLIAVSGERDSLSQQVERLTAQRDAAAAEQRSADAFAAGVGPSVVAGRLNGARIVLLSAAGAQSVDRDVVIGLIKAAGGAVTGEVVLTDAVTDPARADQLRELTSRLLPTGAQLPAASDPGSLAGGLLGGALLARPNTPEVPPAQVAAALAGLAEAGFVRPGAPPPPAQLAVILSGGSMTGVDAADQAAVLARMAVELDRAGGGAVLAGRTGSADAAGGVAVVRADGAAAAALSTVDDLQTAAGRIATVLALREQADGRAGKYGSGLGAQSSAPGVAAG